MLYQENKEKGPKQEIDFANAIYTPYHPRARRLYKMLEEEFGITVIFKKTQTLGDILLKKGRSIEKQHRKNIIYSIPCKDCPKKYVGQTTGTLRKRCKEHENWCKKKYQRFSKPPKRMMESHSITTKQDTPLTLQTQKF